MRKTSVVTERCCRYCPTPIERRPYGENLPLCRKCSHRKSKLRSMGADWLERRYMALNMQMKQIADAWGEVRTKAKNAD